jgi:hypothetical protein
MYRLVMILMCFFILFTVGGTSFVVGEDATSAHVAVVRFANGTSSTSYDAVCKAETDTLLLNLQQLGCYRVQSEDRVGSGEDALRAMAAEERLDYVIYGEISKSTSGSIDCLLWVYDRAKGKTSPSQTKTAAGVLDIFDAADALGVSVLESMTGSHIGFGSLTLSNTGEKGSYRVLIDGYSVGADVASLERVLNGRHTVMVLQRRMQGEREIARSSVEIKEGETAEIQFAVPYLMDDEKAKVEGLKAAIGADWNVAKAMGMSTRRWRSSRLSSGTYRTVRNCRATKTRRGSWAPSGRCARAEPRSRRGPGIRRSSFWTRRELSTEPRKAIPIRLRFGIPSRRMPNS